MEKLSYVYMMCSASRRALYTGVTVPFYKRVWEHKNNLGGYFTAKYKCHHLVYFESYGDINAAIDREKEIKGWRREKKNKLVESMNPDWKDLAADWYLEGLLKDGIPVDSTKQNARPLGPTRALMKTRAREDAPRDDEFNIGISSLELTNTNMRWRFANPDPTQIESLRAEAKVPPLIARLLALRGVTAADAAHYLSPSLDQLHSPYLMRGMTAAVERISAAIANNEGILIYGDYDVDGTSAVVILKTAIELCGGAADFHVPHRIKEGYGMKDDVIERAAAAGIKVVISVDTGIRAFHAAETARRVGLDLIVTDHHLPEAHEGVPNALAVLNPNQQGCDYPCKELCGAGVAFKIAQALFAKFKDTADQARLIPSFLKMVAIATIADAVPLVGENRIIARLGLEGLRRPVNGGLKALMEVSGLNDGRALAAGDVGFRLGPRINAAGRMDVARDVIELFTCRDQARCQEIAGKLNQLNLERQEEEARIVAAIEEQLAAEPDLTGKYCMVFDGDGWHRGVVGIVASRVVEKTGRPALVIAKEGDEAHGSGRSISAFHLLDALESCHDLFTRFGGHEHAVGFALPSKDVPLLKQRLNVYAQTKLTPEDLVPQVLIDAEIPLTSVTPDLFHQLGRLEPFGQGNPVPVFSSSGVNLLLPPKVLKEKHIKLRVNQKLRDSKPSFTYEAVGWRMAERLQSEPLAPGDALDVVFTVGMNSHPDFGGLELTLEDFRKTAPAADSVCR